MIETAYRMHAVSMHALMCQRVINEDTNRNTDFKIID